MAAPVGFGVDDFDSNISLIYKARAIIEPYDEYNHMTESFDRLETTILKIRSEKWALAHGVARANLVRGLIFSCREHLERFLQTSRELAVAGKAKSNQESCLGDEIQTICNAVANLSVIINNKLDGLNIILNTPNKRHIPGSTGTWPVQETFPQNGHLYSNMQIAGDARVHNGDVNVNNYYECNDAAVSRLETITSNMENRLVMKLQECILSSSSLAVGVQRPNSNSNYSFKSIQDHTGLEMARIEELQRQSLGFTANAVQELSMYLDRVEILVQQLLRTLSNSSVEVGYFLGQLSEVVFQIRIHIQRSQDLVPRQPVNAIEDAIQLHDSLGRIHNLPHAYFCYWEVFESYLRCKFHESPGDSLVRRGQYHILDTNNAGRIVRDTEWAILIHPSSQVSMSMVITGLVLPQDRCPNPNCGRRRLKQECSTGSMMTRCACGLEYNLTEEKKVSNSGADSDLQNSAAYKLPKVLASRHNIITNPQSTEEDYKGDFSLDTLLTVFKRMHVRSVVTDEEDLGSSTIPERLECLLSKPASRSSTITERLEGLVQNPDLRLLKKMEGRLRKRNGSVSQTGVDVQRSSKVSELAKRFEELSREFEKQRLREERVSEKSEAISSVPSISPDH